jgi:large subunit ribosomal protein L14
MLFVESKLSVIDNSGVKFVKCIKVLGQLGKSVTLGSLVLVVLSHQSSYSKSTNLGKKVILGLVVHLKYPTYRLDGSYIKFYKNSLILMASSFKPLSTRVLKPLVKELSSCFISLLLKAKLCI